MGAVVRAGSGASVEVLGPLVGQPGVAGEPQPALPRNIAEPADAMSSPRTGRAVDATTESAPASGATPTADSHNAIQHPSCVFNSDETRDAT